MPKKASKTVLPDPLPNGEILTDITKKKWSLGPSIGKGGFGEIYSAAEYTEGSKKNLNYQYVVKIEPHGNGPLFCEMHFFMRNAKPDMINNWCTEKKVSILGIPRYLGSGSHEHDGKKYRFLVMDKYGKDLWHIFLENRKSFPIHTVFRLGLQLLDSLEYIHNNGYVHADLKGANILLGLTKQTQNQAFLVDFGLASKYTQKEFKPDPKKAHNGTIEYTSRDAHDGVPTRRGDIEILAYNIVQWMGCVLPWEKNLKDPVVVQNSKKKYMSDITAFLDCCFGKNKAPAALKELLDYVSKMYYDTEPDYKKLRTILTKGLKASGGSSSGAFEFKANSKHKNEDDIDSETPEKKVRLTPGRKATPRSKLSAKEDTDVETPVSKGKGRSKRLAKTSRNKDLSDEEDVSRSSEIDTPERTRKTGTKGKGRSKRLLKTSKNEDLSDMDSDADVDTAERKVRGRSKNGKINKRKVDESDNDSDDNIPAIKTKLRNKTPEVAVLIDANTNGFNTEMLRLQKKIADRNASKTKRSKTTLPSNGSTSSGSGMNTPNYMNDDVIEATPPEVLNSVRRKIHTPGARGDSQDITPTRGVRQRR